MTSKAHEKEKFNIIKFKIFLLQSTLWVCQLAMPIDSLEEKTCQLYILWKACTHNVWIYCRFFSWKYKLFGLKVGKEFVYISVRSRYTDGQQWLHKPSVSLVLSKMQIKLHELPVCSS